MAKKVLFIIVVLLLTCRSNAKSENYQCLWRAYEQSEEKGFPKTALKIVESIYNQAKAEHNTPQLFRAYLCKTKLNEELLPGSIYADLLELENWVQEESDCVDNALLNAILANLYMQYYNTKRVSTDHLITPNDTLPLSEWTKEMILQRIDSAVNASIYPVQKLKKKSTLQYNPFAQQGIMSCYFNHDLYHAVALTAVNTYKGLSYAYRNTGFVDKIVAIYNKLLSEYSANAQASFLIQFSLVDFNRNFNDETYYLTELDRLIKTYRESDVVVEAYLKKAEYLSQKDKLQEAYELAAKGLKLFPNYCRIAALKVLKNTLLTPVVSAKCDEIIYPLDSVKVELNYKNVSQLSVEVLNNDKKVLERHLLSVLPTVVNKDTVLFLAPLSYGKYNIQLKGAAFKKNINKTFYVSRLKMLHAFLPDNRVEFLLLDSKCGAPIEGGEIEIYNDKKELLKRCQTDALGSVVLDLSTFKSATSRYYFLLKKDDDNASPMFSRYIYSSTNDRNRDSDAQKREMIKILTDRTIYQSGQKIEVKGVVEEQQGAQSEVVIHKNYLLALTQNEQIVYQQKVTTNSFGSFYHSIPLPKKMLNGEYQIIVNGKMQAVITVLSYERPSFKITIDKPKGEYQLIDTLSLSGTVSTYSGLPITLNSLEYKIFCTSYNNWRNISNRLITSHDVVADKEGRFSFSVPLIATAEQGGNNYLYTIQIKAVDDLGEVQMTEYQYAFGKKNLYVREKSLAQLNNKTVPLSLEFEVCNANRQEIDKVVHYHLLDKATGKIVESGELASNVVHQMDWNNYSSGRYQLSYSVKDKKMNVVREVKELVLFSPSDKRPVVKSPQWFYLVNDKFDLSHNGEFYFGTSFKNVYLRMTVMNDKEVLERKIIELSDTICHFQFPYQEKYGSAIAVNLLLLHEGKQYSKTVSLTKRELNQKLFLKWTSFRDKITPNHHETWGLKVLNEDELPVQAEVLALMYDASLDALGNREQTFYFPKNYFYSFIYWQMLYPNVLNLNLFKKSSSVDVPEFEYDHFYLPTILNRPILIRGYSNKMEADIAPNVAAEVSETLMNSQIDLRDNFEETAFFYPQLRTNEKGEIDFSFLVPGSMTQWNFRAYAHTKDGKRGVLRQDGIVAQKNFVVRPYLPRFVRVNDRVTVRTILTNLTQLPQNGNVTFELFDPLTEELLYQDTNSFSLDPSRQTTLQFVFSLDHYLPKVACRVVAESDDFSDGEQHLISVFENQQEVVQSFHHSFSSHSTRDTLKLSDDFAHFMNLSGAQKLTLQFYNGFSWPAIETLPALDDMDSPELIGQISTFYSNYLARYLMVNSRDIASKIDSTILHLTADEEQQKILDKEFSPWSKMERYQSNIAFVDFFKYNRLNGQVYLALEKIKEVQNDDGSFSWVKGMSGNLQLTLWVLRQFNHLDVLVEGHLFDDESVNLIKEKALNFLKTYYQKECEEYSPSAKELTSNDISYLYILAMEHQKEEFQKDKVTSSLYHLLEKGCYQLDVAQKAKAAIIFFSLGNRDLAQEMLKAIKEYLYFDKDFGCYLPSLNAKGTSTSKSLATHISVMEALFLIEGESSQLHEMSRWLMSQKTLMLWQNKRDTLDAIYLLLMQGLSDLKEVNSFSLLQDGKTLELQNATYQVTCDDEWSDAPFIVKHSASDECGVVMTISAHMPYDMIKTTSSQFFEIEKKSYKERAIDNEITLVPFTDCKVKTGDVLVHRLVIKVKRPSDFLLVTDNYSAALEPYDYQSSYAYGDDIAYYKEVKNGMVKFYIDHLNVGTYVLENRYRVVRQGEYNSGIVLLQSMVDPDYRSYYQSTSLKVDE